MQSFSSHRNRFARTLRWLYRLLPVAGALTGARANAAPKNLMNTLTNYIDQSGILPGATPDPEKALGALISSLLGLLGMVFFLLILYGGYHWMMARGNEAEVEKAKKIITSSSVGLGVVLGAYLIAFIVMELILAQTARPTP